MGDIALAIKGETNIGYIIAPPNATDEDKKKADLVLDDVNGSPHTQLADMVDMLHDRRSQNTDIAIVIEFCPGVIELPEETNWSIIASMKNIYLYGNGVIIQGHHEDNVLKIMGECYIYDIEVTNSNYNGGTGIYAGNSTLSNCTGNSEAGTGISANNSTLSNCTGTGSGYGTGISAINSTLSNCTGNLSGPGTGIYAGNSTLSNCTGNLSGPGTGISANNSTLSNCTGNGEGGISATSSTLSNCSGSSDYGQGISATNSTLSNCSGNGGGAGINAISSCIIQGCDGIWGGISVPNGFVETYPNTLALLQAFNKGSIIERD